MPAFTFAVIADSHFHADPGAEEASGSGTSQQQGYKSDASFNARNAAVIAEVQAAKPVMVFHLGDVPHPVPGLTAHHAALDVARRTYAGLTAPLHIVPGNHDVGDKPNPWAPAPSVSAEKHAVFQAAWGPPWWSLDHGGGHFVGLDTPVLNSGLPLEDQQWAWLEADLEAAHGRIFAFLHYPPFLLSHDEDEHYDNLAQPARGRLLDLFAQHGVEAAFCGHVHHPFIDWHRGTAWYLLPSTAFVRPGFSELARIEPQQSGEQSDEHGRNDRGRLGWCLVHIDDEGHRVEWVRSEGAVTARSWAPGLEPGRVDPVALHGRSCPVAVTLRHAWDAVADVPADNLDPFRRKRARNDLALLAALQLGTPTLRLPIEDLRRPDTRRRLLNLPTLGLRIVLFTAQPLTAADVDLLSQHSDAITALELIAPRHWLSQTPAGGVLPGLQPPPQVPLWLSVHGQSQVRDDVYFDHFPAAGFSVEDPALATLPACAGLVMRVPAAQPAWQGIQAAVAAAADAGSATAVAQVLLPRLGEGDAFVDDLAVARRVAQAVLAARAWPDCQVQLDGFVDHDRGYYPRHGLLDRRGDPRPAWHVLHKLSRLVPAGSTIQPLDHSAGAAFDVAGLGTVMLPERPVHIAAQVAAQSAEDVEYIDLVTGSRVAEQQTAHPFLVRRRKRG